MQGTPLRRHSTTAWMFRPALRRAALRRDAAFRSDVSAQTENAGEKCSLDAGFGSRQVNHDHATLFAIRAMLSAILHPYQVTRPINRAIIVGYITTDDKKLFVAIVLMRNRGVSGLHFVEVESAAQRSVAIMLIGQAIGDAMLVNKWFEFDFIEVCHPALTLGYRL